MALFIVLTVFITLITGIVHLIIKRIEYYKLRSRIGLRGPETHWFFGNLMQMVERTRSKGYNNSNEWHQTLHKEYGETFALVLLNYDQQGCGTFSVYLGKQLNIVVSNPEDVKEIFVRNFANFSDRVVPPILDKTRFALSLLQLTYASGWKSTRAAVSPIFSSGKLKSMHFTINQKIETFLEILEEKMEIGDKWDIYEDFQALTMDVIGKCAFAIDSDCQRNREELFYVQARKFVTSVDIRANWILRLSFVFPEFSWFWKSLYRFTDTAVAEKPLIDGLSDVYERRKAGEGTGSVDLLSLLMEKEEGRTMTKEEVIENCFAFLVAGYETTSTAMVFCAYLLARNPAIQNTLYQEILETKNNKGLSYDSIHGMKYLDAVYRETLRTYPPVIHFITRVCLEDIVIRDQLYPKDAMITVLSYTIQRNESLWPNASEFIPERFLDWKGKNGLSWIPFGVGPRYCVGKRFAEMEFKTTIAKLVERFELSMNEEPDVVCDCNGVIMRPKDPVRLTLVKRRL